VQKVVSEIEAKNRLMALDNELEEIRPKRISVKLNEYFGDEDFEEYSEE
jgi:hypothetical protein